MMDIKEGIVLQWALGVIRKYANNKSWNTTSKMNEVQYGDEHHIIKNF